MGTETGLFCREEAKQDVRSMGRPEAPKSRNDTRQQARGGGLFWRPAPLASHIAVASQHEAQYFDVVARRRSTGRWRRVVECEVFNIVAGAIQRR